MYALVLSNTTGLYYTLLLTPVLTSLLINEGFTVVYSGVTEQDCVEWFERSHTVYCPN